MTRPPARRYSWPPFEKGNQAGVKSGAYGTIKRDELAETLRPTLAEPVDALPWITDADSAEKDCWLRHEATLRLLYDELARRMAENDGRVTESDKWLLERIGTAENNAQRSRDRLLLNPLHRFRAGRDVAASELDLARLWATESNDDDSAAHAAVQRPLDGDEETT